MALIADQMRRLAKCQTGLEYAYAVGRIGSVARGAVGMTDAQRLAEIRLVLDALDQMALGGGAR
ncbi:MAG TPA: hypothetical protein VF202_01115 [Trueperaceae bacterium]